MNLLIVGLAVLRLGIVGTDTSHATAFAKLLNGGAVPGARIVAAYKGGSPDVHESASRVDKYAEELRSQYGVEIVPDIKTLVDRADAVLLLSVDGRKHLPQAREVFAAGKKPVFIDKPLASTLADAHEIARLAKQAGVAWFSASALRWSPMLDGLTGDVRGAFVWGPGPTEPHHAVEMTWYGIHAVETLYTLLGPGCDSVTMVPEKDADVVTGRWADGRLGTIRLLRPYGPFGAVVFGSKGVVQSDPKAQPVDYKPLVERMIEFFQTGKPAVDNAVTLEMFAFMDAAQRSKQAGGAPAKLNVAQAR